MSAALEKAESQSLGARAVFSSRKRGQLMGAGLSDFQTAFFATSMGSVRAPSIQIISGTKWLSSSSRTEDRSRGHCYHVNENLQDAAREDLSQRV